MEPEALTCFKCGRAIVPGEGVRSGERVACAACAGGRPPTTRAQAPPRVKGRQFILVGLVAAGAGLGVAIFLLVPAGRASAPARPAAAASTPAPAVASAPAAAGLEVELAALDAKVGDAAAREAFGAALALLVEASRRRPEPAWVQAVESKIAKTVATVKQAFGSLRDQAIEAKKRGAAGEVKAAVDRVAKWGLEDRSAELEKALAGVVVASSAAPAAAPAAAPKPAGEATAYLDKWREAMYLAADRDYGGAIKALEAAAPEIEDKRVQADAFGDVEALRSVRLLQEEAVQALAKLPKGQKVAVEYLDEAGKVRQVEGTMLRSAASWIAIKKDKDTVYVDLAEARAKSLVEAAAARRESDPRAAALFLLLEGEVAAAKAIAASGIPDRYWTLASQRGDPSVGREAKARSLFYAAWAPERETADVQRRGGAAAKYRALLVDYADTAFVRRHRDLLDRLVLPAREYVFVAGDMKGSGAFKAGRAARVPSWTAAETALGAAAKEQFVEFEFEAPADAAYRAWVLAAGCCVEACALCLQATDLVETNPKTKEVIAVEPGANSSLTVKVPVSGLPRTHASHAGKADAPKWDWIALPLPKYTAAGLKRIRLLAEHQGFSVAYALVSSARTSPPSEDQILKELEVGEPDKGGPPPPSGIAAGLVGHWKFDETAGAKAADSSGKGHEGNVAGAPKWVAGRFANALSFDGKDDYVDLGNKPEFSFAGSFTIAFWVRVDSFSKEFQAIVTKGDGAWRVHRHATTPTIGFATNGLSNLDLQGRTKFTDGAWHHVAAIYDGSRKYLYVDGALDASVAVTGKLAANARPVWVGENEEKKGRQFAGFIDDLRLYDRALNVLEIQALRVPPKPK